MNIKSYPLIFAFILVFAVLSGGILTGCAKGDDGKTHNAILKPENVVTSAEVKELKKVSMRDEEYGQNMYTSAFPLIYEDLKKEIVGGKVQLEGFNSYMLNVLNRMDPPENRIDEKYYYKTIAKKTLSDKRKIENDIWKKFKEKSSIIDSVQWEPENKDEIILYSMVKKNVEFLKRFEILEPMRFDDSKNRVKYFGTKENSKLYKNNVKPLFYEDENCYAVSLKTKSEDEIILYMGDLDEPVDIVYDEMILKAENAKRLEFSNDDKLIVPFIDIKESINYVDLINKRIKNTDYVIKQAIESVEFSLDDKGAKLKNEALLAIEKMALLPDNGREYIFNRPFALFMREKGKKEPYFMLKVLNTKYLIEE